MIRRPPRSTRTDTLFPYTTLFRSDHTQEFACGACVLFDCPLAAQGVDVCAAQLDHVVHATKQIREFSGAHAAFALLARVERHHVAVVVTYKRRDAAMQARSEERSVGKECVSTCRSRWSPYH